MTRVTDTVQRRIYKTTGSNNLESRKPQVSFELIHHALHILRESVSTQAARTAYASTDDAPTQLGALRWHHRALVQRHFYRRLHRTMIIRPCLLRAIIMLSVDKAYTFYLVVKSNSTTMASAASVVAIIASVTADASLSGRFINVESR